MTIRTQGRRLTEVVVQTMSRRYNFEAASLRNLGATAYTAALQLVNESMQDIMGFPLAKISEEVYELVEAGDEATCDAVLLMHETGRHQLFDPDDGTASLAAAGAATTGVEYLVLDNFTGVVMAPDWHPMNDMLDAAFDGDALDAALEALGAKIAKKSPTIQTQTT